MNDQVVIKETTYADYSHFIFHHRNWSTNENLKKKKQEYTTTD